MAAADELLLSSGAQLSQPVEASRFAQALTGQGFLNIDWSATADRLVEHGRVPFDVTHVTELTFTLDMSRAVSIKNLLAVRLSFDGLDERGEVVHQEASGAAA